MEAVKVKIRVEKFDTDNGIIYNASIIRPRPQGIKGCPLGSSTTYDRAVADLVMRVVRESNIKIVAV